MVNIKRKPYEISLWEETLIWQRRKLEIAENITKDNYEPGVYYYDKTSEEGAAGAAIYVIDHGSFNEAREYYSLQSQVFDTEGAPANFLEGESAADVEITEARNPEWYNDGELVPQVILQYYKETKVCVLGSNTMSSPARIRSPKLVSNVNGSNTLTFSLYYKYYDEDEGDFVYNPFYKLLVNERKIKLRLGDIPQQADDETTCEWYDFIVKNIQENSDNKTYSYTCKDQFINELSKSGFDIILDAELENNTGTVTELAEAVLSESDWKVGDSEILVQYKEEPLYRILVGQDITAEDIEGKQPDITIFGDSQQYIYAFYSQIMNKETNLQFLYTPNKTQTDSFGQVHAEEVPFAIDDDRVILRTYPNYVVKTSYDENGVPTFTGENVLGEKDFTISSDYRGDRIVNQEWTKYDATIDKYVTVYKKGGIYHYGFTKKEYLSPNAVNTYIVNGASFTSDDGWQGGRATENGDYPLISLCGYPDIRDVEEEEIATTEYKSFLVYKSQQEGSLLYNSGFSSHRSAIHDLSKDEQYVLRIKYATATINEITKRPQSFTYFENTVPDFKVCGYSLEKGVYVLDESKLIFDSVGAEVVKDEEGYTYAILPSKLALSYSDLLEGRYGMFFNFDSNTTYYIEDVQFFKYVTYEKEVDGEKTEKMCVPGGELFSSVKTTYIYYLPNPNYESIDDLVPTYEGSIPSSEYEPVYRNDNHFEKVRSITAKESNRFNLIQDLCETFECWASFKIKHNMITGEILMDQNYRQEKWVSFREYIGKDNYAGFRYGINLKSIQRTLNSDGFVSKMIVKNNANQFAPNGFCNIARAKDNQTGENFILDFQHYVNQGLIPFSVITNDLYLETGGYLGYYKKLKRFNENREAWIDEQSFLLVEESKYEATYQTYKISVESAQEELTETHLYIRRLTGWSYEDLVAIYKGTKEVAEKERTDALKWWEDDGLQSQLIKLAQLNNLITQHTKLRDDAKSNLDGIQSRQRVVEKNLEELAFSKKTLNLQFYKKYSRFIQEGSWINEDYVDDNLYYLDAENTLHTSAQPKVTYTINVLEISQLEEFENYSFELGDKTFIEDTEFFGWVWQENGSRSPYHEEIVVSEITLELDSPEKNTIKVQNYKTQFEDLFQRITATTQSVEFHTGEYAKTSAAFEKDGTISVETLQNSVANNAIRLENAKDQSVIWDETGITTTSLSKPSEIVRIVSGGIFLSKNGGVTWNTGITGAGINATYITSGQLNTSSVYIMNGDIPSFRWDGNGISAYEFLVDETTREAYNFNPLKYVRYDQYGLYGISGTENFSPTSITEVEERASFALTWNGFLLKNSYGDGYVTISSKDDIVVSDGTHQRIKIGRLSQNKYGLRIRDKNGDTVMVTDSDGKLWLENALNVQTYDSTHQVTIGKLDSDAEKDSQHGGRVIDANEVFRVYEDGHVKAKSLHIGDLSDEEIGDEQVYIKGNIIATGGRIGNMTIEEFEEFGIYETKITSDQGTIFKGSIETIKLTAHLYRNGSLVGPEEGNFAYQWKINGVDIPGENSQEYIATEDNQTNDAAQYSCEITFTKTGGNE